MKFLIMYLGFNMIFLIKSIVLYSKYKKEVVERNKNELFKSFISILLFGSIFYLFFEIANIYLNFKHLKKNRQRNKK